MVTKRKRVCGVQGRGNLEKINPRNQNSRVGATENVAQELHCEGTWTSSYKLVFHVGGNLNP